MPAAQKVLPYEMTFWLWSTAECHQTGTYTCQQPLISLSHRHNSALLYNFCLSNAIHCMGQNIKSLAACVSVCLGVRTRFVGQISRKRLEIEVRFQWDINRKWHMVDRLVTWPMTSRDLERSRSWPRYIWGPLSRKWLEIEYRLQ